MTDIDELENSLEKAENITNKIKNKVERQKEKAKELVEEKIETKDIETEKLDDFVDKPYVILPKSENESWIVVPRFVPFNVGWLERQTESYNIFIVNKYVDWITSLPDKIKDRVGIDRKYDKAKVENGEIEFSDSDERDQAWEDLGGREGGLYSRKGDSRIKIKKGKEFEVIAEIIDQGNLPFTSQPVRDNDKRSEPTDISLKEFQKRAYDKFLEHGAIGIYWAPGAGKTFVSLYAGDTIKGKKLVVVPSNTLKEQWKERIKEFVRKPREWEVQTYQYLTQYDHLKDYNNIKLCIFDEVHHLPANTFSKLATLDMDYRIGLSASPYREDGKTEYIFALTGFPVGLKWRELIEVGAVQEPDVKVYLYSTDNRKEKGLKKLIKNKTGKILIFCDSIKKGKKMSKKLEVPFVHGETNNRMNKFRDNRVVMGSRVADEGVSLPDIDVVIEFDFLYGSRRQESQRAGRVMHGEGEGEHIIMMTDEELDKYEKRLYSLEEQGFRINFERRR